MMRKVGNLVVDLFRSKDMLGDSSAHTSTK
jgi:hypothetical protein